MTDKGRAFLLKIGDGGEPPDYATVAGLRVTKEEWSKDRLTIGGTGIFTSHGAEARLKTNALAGLLDDYEISFEDGQVVHGNLLVTRLDYAGDRSGERAYSIVLEGKAEVQP